VAHRQLRQATTGNSWVKLGQETAGSGWDRRQLGQAIGEETAVTGWDRRWLGKLGQETSKQG
jgi:hypothetical protein